MAKRWKCKLSHEDYPESGGFRAYEQGRAYEESEIIGTPGLPYWEPVTPPTVEKKKTGGKRT